MIRLALLVCATQVAHADDDPFVRSRIELSRPVSARILWHVDEDERADFVLYDGARVAVHLQRGDGSFVSTPDVERALPEGTTLFAFEDLDGDHRLDLFAFTPKGFRALRLLDGAALELAVPAASETLFAASAELTPQIYWSFFHDLCGDARRELVVPLPEGLWCGELPTGRSVRLPASRSESLTIDPPGLEGRLRRRTGVPPLAFTSRAGGTERLALSQGRRLEWFEVVESQEGAALATRHLASWEIVPTAEGPDPWFGAEGERAEILERAQLEDIQGDGWPDLVRWDASARAFAFAWGGPGARRIAAPDQVLRVASEPSAWRLLDLDGDGRRELVLFEERDVTQPGNALRAWLGGGSPAQILVFGRADGSDRFAPYPSARLDYRVRTAVGSQDGSFELALRRIADLGSDFDGDGRLDFLVQPADGRLELRPGRPGPLFDSEPAWKLEIPSDETYRDIALHTGDMDSDGRADFALHYRGWDGSPAEQIVVFVQR